MRFSNPYIIRFDKIIRHLFFPLDLQVTADFNSSPAESCAGETEHNGWGIQGAAAGHRVSVTDRKGSPLVSPAHAFCVPLAWYSAQDSGLGGLRVSMRRERKRLAGSRLAVCMKIQVFARLASNIKIIHGGKR